MKGAVVQCHSGHAYAERPVSFVWQDVTYRVAQVVKEWREPGAKHFRISTEDNSLFELCYNEQEDEWLVGRPLGKEGE